MHGTVESTSPAPGTAAVAKVAELQPLVVSIADAQKLLGGISERGVYRLIDDDELETILVGQGRRMILVESINAYVARRRTP